MGLGELGLGEMGHNRVDEAHQSRGHTAKIVKTHYQLDIRRFFFSERVPYRNSLAFVTLCLNLDGQLCRDLNSGARGVVAKHLPTRPRSLSTGYS